MRSSLWVHVQAPSIKAKLVSMPEQEGAGYLLYNANEEVKIVFCPQLTARGEMLPLFCGGGTNRDDYKV